MDFGGRFVIGAGESEVDAFVEFEAEFFPFFGGETAKIGIVGAGHVGKAHAEAVIVRADQRICWLQIDVIAQDDQRAFGVGEIDAAGGVGEDDGFYAHALEDADR